MQGSGHELVQAFVTTCRALGNTHCTALYCLARLGFLRWSLTYHHPIPPLHASLYAGSLVPPLKHATSTMTCPSIHFHASMYVYTRMQASPPATCVPWTRAPTATRPTSSCARRPSGERAMLWIDRGTRKSGGRARGQEFGHGQIQLDARRPSDERDKGTGIRTLIDEGTCTWTRCHACTRHRLGS